MKLLKTSIKEYKDIEKELKKRISFYVKIYNDKCYKLGLEQIDDIFEDVEEFDLLVSRSTLTAQCGSGNEMDFSIDDLSMTKNEIESMLQKRFDDYQEHVLSLAERDIEEKILYIKSVISEVKSEEELLKLYRETKKKVKK